MRRVRFFFGGCHDGVLGSEKASHLLQFGESERVAVLGSELHEPHVGGMRELRDDAETGEQPETGEIKRRRLLVKDFCRGGGPRVAVMDSFNLLS